MGGKWNKNASKNEEQLLDSSVAFDNIAIAYLNNKD